MDWNDYRQQFIAEAHRQNRSLSFIEKHLAYAEKLIIADLPVIFNAKDLSALLGYQLEALLSALDAPHLLYRRFFIAKKGSGKRRIDQPLDSLHDIQQWILAHILNKCTPHHAAMAFTKNRSIKLNALPHVKQPQVLSLDVKDFFPSLHPEKVIKVFSDMGYAQEVAEILTGLTTLGFGLPQGAPTSPALSNLIMIDIDEYLARFATRSGISYTRYADDLTFSGAFTPGKVIDRCRFILKKHGLKLNETKTRLMWPHQCQEVTGVVVNKKLQAPRGARRRLRQEIYFIERRSLEAHESWCHSLYSNRRDHLRGLAEHILFLNPQDRDALKAIALLGRYTRVDSSPSR